MDQEEKPPVVHVDEGDLVEQYGEDVVDEFDTWAGELGLAYCHEGERTIVNTGCMMKVPGPRNWCESLLWRLNAWKLRNHWLCWTCWKWRLGKLFNRTQDSHYD